MLGYFKMQIRTLTGLRHDSRAMTVMEYGLVAALIAMVCIAALTMIGTNLSPKLPPIAAKLT